VYHPDLSSTGREAGAATATAPGTTSFDVSSLGGAVDLEPGAETERFGDSTATPPPREIQLGLRDAV
jgi:hypothetical protein